MFTEARLKISDYDKTIIELWVKCDDLSYYFIFGFYPPVDYPCLKWKLEKELKIKPENIWIDPEFRDYYNTLTLDYE